MLAAAVVILIGAAVVSASCLTACYALRRVRERRLRERQWAQFLRGYRDLDRELDVIWRRR